MMWKTPRGSSVFSPSAYLTAGLLVLAAVRGRVAVEAIMTVAATGDARCLVIECVVVK